MATQENETHSWYYNSFYPYYSNGWQNGPDGRTAISAGPLNDYDNWMKNFNNFGYYLAADLNTVYYPGEDDDPEDFIKIADYSTSYYSEKAIYIPNYQKQIDALEARIAALEGNT